MENKAHALAAGAFVLLVAALLVAMAWWLSREGGVRVNYELSSRDSVSPA
jgi:phospholipid/cholesterol/gamma-HCH transport system substrate-binding protein